MDENFLRGFAETKSYLPAFMGLDEAAARELAATLGLKISVLAGPTIAANTDLRSDRVRVSLDRRGLVVFASAG